MRKGEIDGSLLGAIVYERVFSSLPVICTLRISSSVAVDPVTSRAAATYRFRNQADQAFHLGAIDDQRQTCAETTKTLIECWTPVELRA